jgi:outer membrane protein insertion porin family
MKRSDIILIVIIALIPLSQAYSQGKIRLLGLSVEGHKTADQGLILANSGMVVGSEITGDDIQLAIRQIWNLGLFSDVRIMLDKELPEGAILKIVVEEFPRLEKIEVSGNKKLKKGDIEKLLDFFPGQVLRPDQTNEARNKLIDKYAEDGYLLAKIEISSAQDEATNRQILKFSILEGPKVKIDKITFYGNEAHEKKLGTGKKITNALFGWLPLGSNLTDRKLRKQMKETHQKGLFRSGEFNREKFDEDLQNVVTYYRNHGFRDATVLADSLRYSQDRRKLAIDIYMDEGVRYYFGNFSFTGNTLYAEKELQRQLLVKPGEIYHAEKLEASVRDHLTNMYYDRGYIYANVSPVEIPVGLDTINVHFRIFEGNAFKVRLINIEGNTKTKEHIIRREFVLNPGDTFDVSKLRRSAREVTILNYFSNIVPDVQPVNDDEVDLYFRVEEKSTDQVQVSAGYSQRDGVIGSLGFTMPNLFGNGQSLSLDWQFGRIYRTFSLSITEPWFLNSPTLLGVSFFHTRRGGTYYGFDEKIMGGSLRVGRRLRWPDDYFRIDWIYRLERAVYSNFTSSFAASNPRGLIEDVPRVSSGLTTILTRDSRDNPEFPTTGSVNRYSVEVAGGPFFGNDQFHKHTFSSEFYTPVLGKLVLYSDTEMGVIGQLNNSIQAVPYIEQFFMGGAGLSLGIPLRGYDERMVGPQSGQYAEGGKVMFKQSLELRLPVVYNPTIFVLGFTEAGNVWHNLQVTDMFDLRRSVGLGVRLYMPMIGLIGLDYGYGLDYYNPTTGQRHGEWVPHFQFGRAF